MGKGEIKKYFSIFFEEVFRNIKNKITFFINVLYYFLNHVNLQVTARKLITIEIIIIFIYFFFRKSSFQFNIDFKGNT